jgi:uncharacterized radical SAM superfamily Fe-S cluster-containing enzyme
VSVRIGRIMAEDWSDPLTAPAVEAAKSRWPEPERVVPLVALQNEGAIWRGKVVDSGGSVNAVVYDSGHGLRFD